MRDYAAYADAASGVDGSWKSPGFNQDGTHPVVKASWEDAKKFVAWLTEKERKEGKLAANQSYRLPTDAEWSYAVGIGDRESGGTPKDKDEKLKGVYPCGAGNYNSSLNTDDFDHTSPVGSFAASASGLFDLGGNVWEWCEDFYDGSGGKRVLRGASWSTYDPTSLLSSYRISLGPGNRYDAFGFRCVLVMDSRR